MSKVWIEMYQQFFLSTFIWLSFFVCAVATVSRFLTAASGVDKILFIEAGSFGGTNKNSDSKAPCSS